MGSFTRCVLVVLLLLGPALRGVPPAHAQDDEGYDYEEQGPGPDDEAPDPEDYQEELAPYGSWVDDDQYGRVWQPEVSVGWAPYVDGYWTWSPYGWTWVSYEPWAWTFHYGRWALLPVGWAWVPGSVWGPAWVDWFWGDGFVGWAPLPPFATHVAVINSFVFVHEHDFCSHGLARVVVNHHLVPDRVVHRWQHRDWRRDRAPDVHRIERVSHHPVSRFDHKPPGSIAPRRFAPGHGHQLARPGEAPRLGEARRGHAGGGRLEQGHSRLGRSRYLGGPDAGLPARPEPRTPRLARPRVEPDLGAPRRGGGGYPRPRAFDRPGPGWNAPRGRAPVLEGRAGDGRGRFRRPEGPPAGMVRPAPPTVPRGFYTRSAPSLGEPRHGFGGGAARGHGGGGSVHRHQFFSPGAMGVR